MATLIIGRSNEYINKFRNYGIYIDGEKVDTIANGKEKELTVSAGRHSLFFKIDWCSSPTLSFDIFDNETKRFKVGGFKNASWLMPAGLVLIVISYIVNFIFGIYYIFFLALPVLLLMIYYMTIGRRQYLTLVEDKSERQNTIAAH